jgi:hypothetical protein
VVKRAVLRCGQLSAVLLAPLLVTAQTFHTYIGQISSRAVLVAWGTAEAAGNTIGRRSSSHGKAAVKLGPRTVETTQNWAIVDELAPDTRYPYEVLLNGRRIGGGAVRTYPERADRLVFFVMGDYGNGSSAQYRLADVLWNEYQKRSASEDPVRFVLTTGDNIYADVNFGLLAARSGDEDWHWETKFFRPYERLISEIPFYPTLGNHDGNASESRRDMEVYLDNFFFPGNTPARYYRFSFGGLAEFFALDSTDNTASGPPAAAYGPESAQFAWMREFLPASKAPWKIPYFHHPPFNAGPRHAPDLAVLRHWVDLFRSSGVKVVFNGHEHNFQFSAQNAATGGVCYVISGAGGELRHGNVLRKMASANMVGWAAQQHFLVVEIDRRTMRITPVSFNEVNVRDQHGSPIKLPIAVSLP